MVVLHHSFFPPSEMKVRITSKEGADHLVDLSPDLTVDKLKISSLTHFYSSAEESMKSSLYHRLLLVRTGKVLNEDATLLSEGVRESDELLLLRRRIPPSPFETLEKVREDKKGPDFETIKIITATLPKLTLSMVEEDIPPPVDFQTELRRILISLIEASQRILCLNPAASRIFKNAEEMLNEAADSMDIDEQALKQLQEMGFLESHARKALMLNKMSVTMAMEWLFQHEGDLDLDLPLPSMDGILLPSESQVEGAVGGTPDTDVPGVNNLLQKLKAFRKQEFRPNSRALRKLLEMGFEEQESMEALRIARNDQDAACEWLLGDRTSQPEDPDEGLDPSSPVYKAILANPTVQLGLNNPKCLLAFLQMLENPLYANQWLNHPETGPILMQISRIYHAEKNSPSTPSQPEVTVINSSSSMHQGHSVLQATASTSTVSLTSSPVPLVLSGLLFNTTSQSPAATQPSTPALEPSEGSPSIGAFMPVRSTDQAAVESLADPSQNAPSPAWQVGQNRLTALSSQNKFSQNATSCSSHIRAAPLPNSSRVTLNPTSLSNQTRLAQNAASYSSQIRPSRTLSRPGQNTPLSSSQIRPSQTLAHYAPPPSSQGRPVQNAAPSCQNKTAHDADTFSSQSRLTQNALTTSSQNRLTQNAATTLSHSRLAQNTNASSTLSRPVQSAAAAPGMGRSGLSSVVPSGQTMTLSSSSSVYSRSSSNFSSQSGKSDHTEIGSSSQVTRHCSKAANPAGPSQGSR